MGKEVLKTVEPYDGLKIEIIKENECKFLIEVNGKTESTECCVERAFETFQQILDSFIH